MTISPKNFAKDLKTIKACAQLAETSDIKEMVEAYGKSSLPYAVPVFSKQNGKDPRQRRSNLVGGFPFTSSTHPWPRDTLAGNDMQPVAQLDLSNIGELLDLKLGEGLLQIWCAVYPAAGEKSYEPFLLRVIPPDPLGESPDSYFPTNPAWLAVDTRSASDSGEVDLESAMFKEKTHLVIFDPRTLEKPLMNWSVVGRMFPVDASYIHNVEESEEAWEAIEELQGEVTGPFNGLHLGGYGGAAGRDADQTYVDPAKGRLLLRISDENELHIGIVAWFENGVPARFQVVYRFY